MKVRAKFQLVAITTIHGQTGKRLKFAARYDATIPEDQRFQKASPWGEFEITIDNPVVLDHYQLGEFYYFDSTPVPAPENTANAA